MKVAILTLSSRIKDTTGDVLQAKKTIEALRLNSVEVDHLLLDISGIIIEKDSCEILSIDKINESYDIIHAIPPIPSTYIKSFYNKLKPRLVASTIFWRSSVSTKVLFHSKCRFDFRFFLNDILASIHVRPIFSYKKYDLLLTNSQTEIKQFKKYCRYKKNAKIFAVPNGIDPIPEWVFNIKRFNFLPNEDYILYPGIFSYRKNQLNFIRAMKNTNLKVVFIGGVQSDEYFLKCKSEATKTMKFLGHIKHGSEEFYSCLKHARIACLASDCETPGIALLEAASLGARPVITSEGGTVEYYSWDAEYLNPLCKNSILNAIKNGWERGRLNESEQQKYRKITWNKTAQFTIAAYKKLLSI